MGDVLNKCAAGLSVVLGLSLAAPVAAGPIVEKAAEAEQLLQSGEPIDALERLEEAVEIAWAAAPLIVRKALFVEQADGYGLYLSRAAGSVFKPDEKMLIYVEPQAFGYARNGSGSYSIGFDTDFVLADPEGKVLLSQKDFAKVEKPVRYKNREFFLSLTVTLTGVPAGEYQLGFRLRDQNSDKSVVFQLPVTFRE